MLFVGSVLVFVKKWEVVVLQVIYIFVVIFNDLAAKGCCDSTVTRLPVNTPAS